MNVACLLNYALLAEPKLKRYYQLPGSFFDCPLFNAGKPFWNLLLIDDILFTEDLKKALFFI